METGIPPLSVRCMHLSNKFILKKMTTQNHPLLTKIKLLLQHLRTPTPHWSRNKVILPVSSWEELSVFKDIIRKDPINPCFKTNIKVVAIIPNVIFTPVNKKENTPPELIKQEVQNVLNRISPIDETIFTDGSKKEQLVGAATINQTTKEKKTFKLPPDCSIFTAEALAITAALQIIYSSQSNRFVVCSDSKAVLTALRGNTYKQSTNWLIFDIKARLHKIQKQNKEVHFIWIPSHSNIQGNEEVDREAKLAGEEGEILPLPIPYTDLHPILKKIQLRKWEDNWNQSWEHIRTHTSLRGPQHTPWYRKVVVNFPKNPFTPWYLKQYYDREYITFITRLRIGHCNFPEHLHILGMQENNLCECVNTGTLNHIFFQCPIHEDATAQLIIALENLNLTIEGPRNLQNLLQLNKKQVHDLLVEFLKHEKISI